MKKCKYCQNDLTRKDREEVRHFNVRRFCNQSCSVSFRHISNGTKLLSSTCVKCGKEFQPTKNGLKHCKDCLRLGDWRTTPRESRIDPETTKKLLFSTRKNWQSARSQIRKDAARRFFEANSEPTCLVCGYAKHVEVCHINAVSDFPDSATLSEINDLENLVGLCPNHHWEFDNGLLNLA